jgi:hypothetical protein
MAKIKTGILGGFSGLLYGLVGYRRKGQSIITTNKSKNARSLDPYMVMINNYERITSKNLAIVSALNRNRFLLYSIALEPYTKRVYNICGNFPKKSKVPCKVPSLFSCTVPSLEGVVKYTFNTAAQSIVITWRGVNQPSDMLGNRYTYSLFQNISVSGIFGTAVTTQDSRTGTMTITGARWVTGQYLLLHLGWASSNVAAPSKITVVQSQLFLL